MHPLPLPTEETQQLHWFTVRATEPVRQPGVELCDLPGTQVQIVLGQHQTQPPRQDVQPLVPLVRTRLGLPSVPWQDHLVRLQRAGLAGQRYVGHGLPALRAEPNSRVSRLGCADELVQRDLVRLGQRQQQLKTRLALPRLQP